MKLIKTLSPEQKKLFVVAPAAIGVGIMVLYFVVFSDDVVDNEGLTKNKISLELPESQTKELNNNKEIIFDDFEQYNKYKENESANDFDSVIDDPLGNNTLTSFKTKEEKQLMTVKKQFEEIESKKAAGATTNRSYTKTYSNNKSNNENKKTELSYDEKLRIARERKFGPDTPKEKKVYNTIITTRVAVYGDHFVLPDDSVKLVLIDDFTFQRKTFKAGTSVYADLSIRGNRVLFEISNIAHIPLNIEAKDIRDGKIGMRSKRAGELWQEFERETSNTAQDDVSESIGTETKSKILGRSIKALSEFFKRKKFRKSKKIWILNDQELILTITPIK